MDGIFDKNLEVMSKALDLHLLRHSVISDNIANAETPHYKARRVDFEKELQRAVESPEMLGDRSLSSVRPTITEDNDSEIGQDLNTVDMEREMAEMTKNDLKYSAITQGVTKKFALLQYAITEGNSR